MTWLDAPDWFRETAEQVCTPAELAVLKHRWTGYSWRRTSEALNDTPVSTLRGRQEAALRKIRQHREGDRTWQLPA